MVAPAIESGVIPEPRMVAVVHVAVPVVSAIDAGVVVAAGEVGTRIISMAAKIAVGALHVSGIPARVHDARSVVHTHHRAPAVQTIANVHAAAVDRSNLSIGADAGRTTASQSDVPGSCWRTTGAARAATLGCTAAFRPASTLGRTAAFRPASTLGSAAFCSASTLGRTAAFRPASTLGCTPAFCPASTLGCTAAFCPASTLARTAAFCPASTLGCTAAFRRVATFGCVAAFRRVATFGLVPA